MLSPLNQSQVNGFFALSSFRMLSKIYLLALAIPISSLRQQCCIDKGVTATCANLLCDPEHPPGDIERYTVFDDPSYCKRFLPEIAECLSDGRDTSKCCTDDAERQDLSGCFGLCKGSAVAAFESWSKFQSCFVINLSPIYSCFAEAYDNSPSAPSELRITSQTSTSVSLEWKSPSKNPSLVNRYSIVFTETSGKRHTEEVYESTDTSLSVTNLLENKKYTVTVTAVGEEERYRSQPSDFVQFTTSTQLEISPVFMDIVQLPSDAERVTLACHLRQGAANRGNLIWEKKDRGQWKKVEGTRFSITTYSEKLDDLYYFVSSLEINGLERSDFSVYKCHLESEINDYGEVRLIAHSFSESEMPVRPPETVLECCRKVSTRPHCNSVCSGTSTARDVKPGAFLPQFRCFDEFNTLMRCTLQQMNNVGCCITKKIPYHCLGMCDSRFMIGNIFLSDCVEYVNKVFSCQEERTRNLPYAVSSLIAKTTDQETVLEWEPSRDAEVYHVYHRNRKGTWIGGATVQTKTVISSADEVAVLAVNKFGYSGANRLTLVDNRWSSSYLQ